MKRRFGHVVHELNINACGTHRRRIKTEEKAKVVACVWELSNLFNSLPR